MYMARVRAYVLRRRGQLNLSDDSDNTLQPGVDFGLKVASPVGNLVGQVFFGWLADLVGRKRMCKSESSIWFSQD